MDPRRSDQPPSDPPPRRRPWSAWAHAAAGTAIVAPWLTALGWWIAFRRHAPAQTTELGMELAGLGAVLTLAGFVAWAVVAVAGWRADPSGPRVGPSGAVALAAIGSVLAALWCMVQVVKEALSHGLW